MLGQGVQLSRETGSRSPAAQCTSNDEADRDSNDRRPPNEYVEKAANSTTCAPERTTRSSYAEVAAICHTKVGRLPKSVAPSTASTATCTSTSSSTSSSMCATASSRCRIGGSRGNDDKLEMQLPPLKSMGVKRVADIYDEPEFFIDGPSANYVRQGNEGDC